MRYLVTGASGLLGVHLGLHLAKTQSVTGVVNHRFLHGLPFTIRQQDLTDLERLEDLIKLEKPDCIIHCAAMANIDECEKHPQLANVINVQVPRTFSELTRKHGIRFVHISTDAVFDGLSTAYTETDSVNPLSVYARTKAQSEIQVLDQNSEAIVARVNFYGWSVTGKRSLGEWFYYQLAAHNQVKGFTDIQFCPLYVEDLAKILIKLAETDAGGLYHSVSSEHLSKYQFGVDIANKFGLDSNLITPVSWVDGGLTAARSPNLILDVTRIETLLGMTMPDQRSGIEAFHHAFIAGHPKRLLSYDGLL